MQRWWLGTAILVVLFAARPALGQLADEQQREPAADGFGPVILIEAIEIVGNEATATRIIRRALPFREGQSIRAGDPRLVEARYKVLALGYFRDVAFKLEKGSRRGQVVLTVVVVERGTVVLERIFFGRTEATPWWAGLDLTERNLFGTGLGLGGGFIVAGEGGAAGAQGQWSGQLRLDDPSILGAPFGAYLSLSHVDASEPFRVAGSPDDSNPENFETFNYTRNGAKGGVTYDLTPLSRIVTGLRVEGIEASLPATVAEPELILAAGRSWLVNLSAGFDRDTRAHPILPWNGTRSVLHAELGSSALGGSYDYLSLIGQFGKWWALRDKDHVLSVHLTGALVLGDAPIFERLFVGDLNKLLTPRELGLVLSTRESLDLFGTGSDENRYGSIGGVAEAQYSRRLFRGGRHIYGGDIFFGVGLWTLGDHEELSELSTDMFVDAGLRLDTELGIFELSLANGIGRIPF